MNCMILFLTDYLDEIELFAKLLELLEDNATPIWAGWGEREITLSLPRCKGRNNVGLGAW